MAQHRSELVKIILHGGSRHGKTKLLDRLSKKKYENDYRATIGADFISHRISSSEETATLQIWDTAGQDRFRGLGNAFYRGADLGVLCISAAELLKNPEKLETELEEFRAQTNYPEDHIPCVLIVTKCDEEGMQDEEKKKISASAVSKAAETFAKGKGVKGKDGNPADLPILYTSAKDDKMGANPDLSKATDKVSVNFGQWLYQQYLPYKQPQSDISVPEGYSASGSMKPVSPLFSGDDAPQKPSFFSSVRQFISRNRWELAIGLAVMLGMALFFGLYMFNPVAGFVVSGAIIGLMNLGIGLVPSIYMAIIGVPVLATVLGFCAGFFGTKIVRHLVSTPNIDKEMSEADKRKSVTPSEIYRALSKDSQQEDEYCPWLSCTSPFSKCCGPESKGYEPLGEPAFTWKDAVRDACFPCAGSKNNS